MHELAQEEGSEYWMTEADRLSGWIHYNRDELDLSRSCFMRCRQSVMKNPTEYIPAATSYSLGSPEQVESLTATYVFALALVDLKEGLIDSAKSRLEDIKSMLPGYAELLHSEINLAEGSPEKAITVIAKAPPLRVPYMSDTGGMLVYNLPFLKDTLARAYLQKEDLEKAATEYEKVSIFHPDSSDRRLIHPFYHYRLGKIYQRQGFLEKALSRYSKALEIWKQADWDFPELEDTRARLGQLS
jgi:tetratricopeptide (TPR) repeat protein